MREYRFQATDETIDALRRLRSAWESFSATDRECTIVLAGGDGVRIEVDTVDVEGVFDAYRLSARLLLPDELKDVTPGLRLDLVAALSDGMDPRRPPLPAPGLGQGGNDIVLFSGASWSEPAGAVNAPGLAPNAALMFSGHVGQISETAEIVCITTDAFVVASTTGEGLLIRTGLRPESIQIVTDADEVRAFLLQRGYGAEDEQPK